MEIVIWLLTLLPCSALFTGIGIYAFKREKPMWFWAGSTVEEKEISDVRAYNRANGWLWLGFSVPFWISTVLGCFSLKAAAVALAVGCVIGIPALPILYQRLYRKYKKHG